MSGHHPTILSTGRYGSWAECSCGWLSGRFRRPHGASVAWATHLATQTPGRPTTGQEDAA